MNDKQKDLNDYLSGFITEQRNEKILQVLSKRHRYITVALEDIYQPHNASAVLRSCDAFGVQDVHIIENRNSYRINPDVELGTAQWLTLHKYNRQENNTAEAIASLKASGYRVVATTPHENDSMLGDLDLSAGPVALLFGTELTGLSEEAISLADEYVRIPMHGFVESFNISVSAAISLYSLDAALRSSDIDFELSDDERETIRHSWLKASLKKWELLENEYFKRETHSKEQNGDA